MENGSHQKIFVLTDIVAFSQFHYYTLPLFFFSSKSFTLKQTKKLKTCDVLQSCLDP